MSAKVSCTVSRGVSGIVISPSHPTMTENFVEVYVNTLLSVCEARDVKGLYAKARSGIIKGFTGIDDPYEEPLNPEVVCYSEKETLEESVAKVFTVLIEMNLLVGGG
jgi:adenylylsulfate kinase